MKTTPLIIAAILMAGCKEKPDYAIVLSLPTNTVTLVYSTNYNAWHEQERALSERLNEVEADLRNAKFATSDYDNHNEEFLRVKRFEIVTNVWRPTGGIILFSNGAIKTEPETNYVTNVVIGTRDFDLFKAQITTGADIKQVTEDIGL